MDLAGYDGKCVRITDRSGCFYDGFCSFNNADFDEHEFGRREVSLEIMNSVFFAGDIGDVELLEDGGGEFGRFRDPYGKLEEELVGDGADAICEALEDALLGDLHPEHAVRLIRCLAAHPEAIGPDVTEALKKLALGSKDGAVREAAQEYFYEAERPKEDKDHFFRVISNNVRFGCGYRKIGGRIQYFAWHGVPNRNDDYFTTSEITKAEFDEIERKYPKEISAGRDEGLKFADRYVAGHRVILEGWNKLL